MESITSMLECPICWDPMTSAIKQCRDGHSFCESCATKVHRCPLCTAPITSTRNYQLESVIANLKDVRLHHPDCCKYEKRGCQVKHDDLFKLKDHEYECKKREFVCEGKLFAGWKCDWTGIYDELYQHFRDKHMHNKISLIEFEAPVYMKIPFGIDFFDVQIIPCKKRNELFWYKCKIDPWREKAYWIIQYIGPKIEAKKYCYQFIIENEPLRVLKAKEICESDTCDTNMLFDCGKCVTVPFSTLRNYLNNNDEVLFTFVIGNVEGCNAIEPKQVIVKGAARNVAQPAQAQGRLPNPRQPQEVVCSFSSGSTFNQISSNTVLHYPPMPFNPVPPGFNTLWGSQPRLMPPMPYHQAYISHQSFYPFASGGPRQRYNPQ